MADNMVATIKKDIGDQVVDRVFALMDEKRVSVPEGYDAASMIKKAVLRITQTKDKNGKTALDVCTKESVAQTLFDMVLQGLDPGKNQCYFIVYGNQLQLFRSYFGTEAALRRAVSIVGKIHTDLVHEGDDVEWAMSPYGERYAARILTDPITNCEKPVVFGFCNIFNVNGELMAAAVMTWKEIQKSWSRTRSGGQTQKDFPGEMAKRTLINRACKHILNSSIEADSIVTAAFNHTTGNEYDREEKVAQAQSSKVSVKERYGIGKAKDEAIDAKAEKIDDLPAEGPESFEDSSFDTDSLPNSEDYNEELF